MTTPPAPLRAWVCPGCGTDRSPDDAFCGRCGAPRPADTVPEAAPGAVAPSPAGAGRTSIRRTLVLNGILLGAVLLAVFFGRGSGPAAITFDPAAWRCDGSVRTWTARLAPSATDLRIEWRSGGPEGAIAGEASTTRLALEPFLTSDGTFRVERSEPDGPECDLAPGTWTMAVRDAANGALLASGDVEIAAP